MKKRTFVYSLFLSLTLISAFSFIPVRTHAATKLEKKAAAVIKAAKVTAKDDDLTKLEKLFTYFTYQKGSKENFKFIANHQFTTDSKKKNWPNTYALSMFLKKGGSCFEFASGYGFAALKATGLPVRAAVGTTRGFGSANQRHAWTEIKIKKKWYVYDTNMQKYSEKYKDKPLALAGKLKKNVKKIYYNYKDAQYFTLKF